MSPPSQPPPARKRPPGSLSSMPARPSGAGAAPSRPSVSGPRRSEAAGSKLVCMAGPKAGTEFPLLGEEDVVIGRATENAVSIPDTSVSRRHAQLRRVPDGWAASDLGSGNGTVVNGERLEHEVVLRHNDTITLGDTEFRFENASETDRRAAPARPRPSMSGAPGGAALARRSSVAGRPDVRARLSRAGAPAADPLAKEKRKRMMMIGGGVAVLICIGLTVAKVVKNKNDAVIAQRNAVVQQQREVLSGMFQEAKNLVREGKWQDAKAKLEEIKGVNANYPGVQDYLERANKEIPNEKNLALASEALQKGDVPAAADALSKVTSDTQMYSKLSGLQQDMSGRMAKLMTDAETAMGNNDVDQVKTLTDVVLKVQPDNRDAKALNDQAVAAIALRNKPKEVAPTAAPKPWEAGVMRFIDGDLTGAIALEDECASRKVAKCKGIASMMREFSDLNKKVEDLDARGLQRLLAVDHEITDGRRSKLAKQAGLKLATALCKSATAAKAAGQFAQAGEKASKAMQADPQNTCAQNILQDLKQKAHDLFMSAYAEKDTDPEGAVEKFKQVIQMTLPDSEDHGKAQTWVNKLQNQ